MTEVTPTWGIVATVRAPARSILQFAAYHLDLGADRLEIFLDAPNAEAKGFLKAHPKVRVHVCDDRFWARLGRARPEQHQVRQTVLATRTYRRTSLDWLAHIDVDEFLWPQTPVRDLLREVPAEIPAIRMRPAEALAGGSDLYKLHVPKGSGREALVQSIYPTYGAFVLGGFLSHVQGKLFVRKGLENINFRIHNLFQNKELLPCKFELHQLDLCHRHAPDWDHWMAHLRFRLSKGSYKPGMTPNVPRGLGGLNMNELLTTIEAEDGTEGLRAFFHEMSAEDPEVRDRLTAHRLLQHRPLNLDAKVAKHFPGTL